MQIITTEAIKAAARAGYLAKTLTAQMELPCCKNYAVEDGDVYQCAVAQALPMEFNKDHEYGDVWDNRLALNRAGFDYESIHVASEVQSLHDKWATTAGSAAYTEAKKKAFLDAIDMPEEQR